ncbi:MAG: hypothetical protein ABS57_21735 [Mesorhizobium sp. SCN 65-12]|nr:MAG: hypothetical protein ABS57_21735 [Mesorhizobium sp. SCN 65-12]
MDDGRVEPRRAIGEAPVARPAAFRRLHQPRHLGQEGILRAGGRGEFQRAGEIERAGLDHRSDCHRHRHAFACRHRTVEAGHALDDASINGHTLAGVERDRHPGLDLRDRQVVAASVVTLDGCSARREPHQRAHRSSRALAHHVVQCAADEQEEDQRRRGVEIGMRAIVQRVVDAEAEGQRDADADRHVHVGAAVAKRPPGRDVEDAAGIDEGGQGERRRDPMEGLPCFGVRAGPDRDGQHHDVHRGESGQRQGAQEPRQFGIGLLALRLEEMRRIADAGQCFEHGRHAFAAPFHGDAPCREVHAGVLDRRQVPQRRLHCRDAGRAVNVGNRQVGLTQPTTQVAAGQRDFLARRRPVELGRPFRSGRAATHLMAL